MQVFHWNLAFNPFLQNPRCDAVSDTCSSVLLVPIKAAQIFGNLILCWVFFAGPNCDVGKEYKSCGTEENTRSCYNKTTDITGEDSICRPGCYCKSGLIMDGDNCIEPEQCGCLYNDFYYSVSIKKTSKEITVLYLEISRHQLEI